MSKFSSKHIDSLVKRYPALSILKDSIQAAYLMIVNAYEQGHWMMVIGNGGSAADAEHLSCELMKGFQLERPLSPQNRERLLAFHSKRGQTLANKLQEGLPILCLTGNHAFNTAICNDNEADLMFAQQVQCYGKEGDVLFAISTSGRSNNVCNAAVVARAKGMKVIGLTRAGNSELYTLSDCCICVPEKETYLVQEYHLPIYHCLCIMIEEHFYKHVENKTN